MQAVILAGGKGTRLYPYTVTFPKPLVPIGDLPIVEIMLRQLRAAGLRDVTISVGHLAELLIAYLGDGSKLGLRIGYVREDKPLGTIGPLWLVQNLPDDFLLMNGDVLTDLDYAKLFQGHVDSGAAVSISTYKRDVKIDLGVLVCDGARVTDYIEKPTYSYEVSMGVYVLNRRVLSHIPRGEYFDFPMLIKELIARGEFVRAVPFDGLWLDIGRPSDYEEAQNVFSTLRERLLPP
ncbi:MAG TPA: sugar phosphate nucleotidyltransferase [Polyangiaceae bacterium]|nr:sugar phosphate nucleotidyltransferase [Polyangiaceae bacterium]